MTLSRGCSETVARSKLCVPKKVFVKASPCKLIMARYQGSPMIRNSKVPLQSFICFNSCQLLVTARNRNMISPGSKKPIGPLVSVAKAAPAYIT